MVNWGGGAKGAAGGAAMGAALGPWGAAAGGVIGGAFGLFGGGGDDNGRKVDVTMPNYGYATGSLIGMSRTAQRRGASQLDPTLMNQSRARLMGTAGSLEGIAAGQTAGAGELAVNRQLGQAYAAQQSAARMARGPGSALAYRNLMRNSADLGLAGAGQVAQSQMQDQQAANQQLAQIYGQTYGQDANVANMNLQSQIEQKRMNDAYQLQSMGQLLGWDQAQINARLAKEGLAPVPSVGDALLQGGGQALAAYSVGQGQRPQTAVAAPPAVTGDNLMPNTNAYSDERLKKNLGDGSNAADHVLASMQPYTYEYRDPSLGAGTQLGVTTQDLNRAGLGQAVVPTPQGDAIHPGKLAGANTAMIARLADRLDYLEKHMKGKNLKSLRLSQADPEAYNAQAALNERRATVAGGQVMDRLRSTDPAAYQAQMALDARRAALSPVVSAISSRTDAINADTARKYQLLRMIDPAMYAGNQGGSAMVDMGGQ